MNMKILWGTSTDKVISIKDLEDVPKNILLNKFHKSSEFSKFDVFIIFSLIQN